MTDKEWAKLPAHEKANELNRRLNRFINDVQLDLVARLRAAEEDLAALSEKVRAIEETLRKSK
jgi:hypothetical protein